MFGKTLFDNIVFYTKIHLCQDGIGPTRTWPWTWPLWPQCQFLRPRVNPLQQKLWPCWPDGSPGSAHFLIVSVSCHPSLRPCPYLVVIAAMYHSRRCRGLRLGLLQIGQGRWGVRPRTGRRRGCFHAKEEFGGCGSRRDGQAPHGRHGRRLRGPPRARRRRPAPRA